MRVEEQGAPERTATVIERRVVNTHVHVPPNFSAFATVEDAVGFAAAEGVGAMGVSNFHDVRVYRRFADAAAAAGILPLFGLEFVSMLDGPTRSGTRINDPANPGRMYLCGKGVDPFAEPTPLASRLAAAVRAADRVRMAAMVPLLRGCFNAAGLETSLTAENIAEEVAERADVPPEWVVLQERHLALAFQEALFLRIPPDHRPSILQRVYGGPPAASVDDAVAVQAEIRSRLMKAGRPAFVPESPVPFEDAYRLVLEMGGIPCYPTLADGADPVCPWEAPADALAARLLERGIFAAELIPERNRPVVVDEYVAAFGAAGIIVMAGTEHNTPTRIPVEPRCADGTLPSAGALAAFWEGTCIVAAHQHVRAQGRPGYVDGEGRLNPDFADAAARRQWFRDLGADLIDARGGTA
jgi:hypothetical protein